MDLLAQIPVIGTTVITLLSFAVTLAIVVFVHEFGHYIVGRWCGIHAETFSLGFGPVLFSRTDRRGTRWQVAALPLGGYVKFVGDLDGTSRADTSALINLSAEDRRRAFHTAAVWRRALTVLAGPVANFILTAVLAVVIAIWVGRPVEPPTVGELRSLPDHSLAVEPGDIIRAVDGTSVESIDEVFEAIEAAETRDLTITVDRGETRIDLVGSPVTGAVIGSVTPTSQAAIAGVEAGDILLSFNGTPVSDWPEASEAIQAAEDQRVPMEVWRDGRILTLTLTPSLEDVPNPEGGFEKRVIIGVGYSPSTLTFEFARENTGPIEALLAGPTGVYRTISQQMGAIGALVRGDVSLTNLSGPIGIARVSGHQAQQSALEFVAFVALISTAIGMINLFPIPVLDGGHLVFFAYEAVAGRPPPEVALRIAMSVGLSLVLLLMLFATYNDIARLIGIAIS